MVDNSGEVGWSLWRVNRIDASPVKFSIVSRTARTLMVEVEDIDRWRLSTRVPIASIGRLWFMDEGAALLFVVSRAEAYERAARAEVIRRTIEAEAAREAVRTFNAARDEAVR